MGPFIPSMGPLILLMGFPTLGPPILFIDPLVLSYIGCFKQ